ncbi:MAG: GrdX family protein [Mogibacterium sp.]|nr:GrdX family protein [Mogibacterium sp.]
MIIVTNNNKTLDYYKEKRGYEVIMIDGTYRDVLVKVRDMLHVGHQLLTHPLMGSIKPNETPYRSIAVSKRTGKVDYDNIILMEEAIMTFDKFALVERPNRGVNATQAMKDDYAEIDLSLISSAIDN